MSRQVLDRILRLRIVGVITKEVHGRDIIERLIKSQTMDLQAFEWQMQLRFYWERSEQNEDCFIRQTMTRFKYNYVPIISIWPPMSASMSICFLLCRSIWVVPVDWWSRHWPIAATLLWLRLCICFAVEVPEDLLVGDVHAIQVPTVLSRDG